MKRAFAIKKLAQKMLSNLSEEEREEQLDIMTMENWSEVEEWRQLPNALQEEFVEGELLDHPYSSKYDEVLLIWLRDSIQAVSNEYLAFNLKVNSVEGEPVKFFPCPCCGSRTIRERAKYNICKVCWWEDDGQDNESADKVLGGPNQGISLTMGRYNYLEYGLYDPARTDLMKIKDPTSKYVRGREFEIKEDYVVEKGTSWQGKIIS